MEPFFRSNAPPKMHLQLQLQANQVGNDLKQNSLRKADLTERNDHHQPFPPSSTSDRIFPSRLYGTTTTYLDSPKVPRLCKKSQTIERPQGTLVPLTPQEPIGRITNSDELRLLHPNLNVVDEKGEFSEIMLSKWSLSSGEDGFTSISLFCEMKMNEAKRMMSWVASPNRFYTTVCCQLLEKYAQKDTSCTPRAKEGGPSTQGNSFLMHLHKDMVDAIFMPSQKGETNDVMHRVPYFIEYTRLKQHSKLLLETIRRREEENVCASQLPMQLNKVLQNYNKKALIKAARTIFHSWIQVARHSLEIRNLKLKMFLASRKSTVSEVFKAWRIESLRRAYQRESTEYQTMLSISAAALSRKDIIITEAEAKLASLTQIVDSLTESNSQLLSKLDQMESTGCSISNEDTSTSSIDEKKQTNKQSIATIYHHISRGTSVNELQTGQDRGKKKKEPAEFDYIDSIITKEDEKMDRLNRMLVETMFGMARMVESCVIQMSKDMMDSLENQLDGSILQRLAEMIQDENVDRMKKEQNSISANNIGKSLKRNSLVIGSGSAVAVTKAVTIRDIAQMPVDAVLLKWMRMNLKASSSTEKSSDRTIKNLTTDLADGRKYSFLLHQLFPTWFDASMVSEIDSDERLKNIANFHTRIQPELPQVVTSDSIHAGSATENLAFIAMLFGTSVGTVRRIDLEKQRVQFLNILTSWKRVRGFMLEVKRMDDNYDTLVVIHLLKEMRTCETLFKQLHTEIGQIAMMSNETSSTLSQIAYKILGLTWNCLNAKITKKHELSHIELIDERWQEKIKLFTFVNASTIREIITFENEEMEKKNCSISEKEIQLRIENIQKVLVFYAKDIHDIYKHYSASTGAGSMASMSLAEYRKFIKDCEICDKRLTQAVADVFYRIAIGNASVKREEGEANATTDGNNNHREMLGVEFTDVLIRLSAKKFFHERVLEDRLREFLSEYILPNALRSQSEIFRAEVASSQVRAVFQKHKTSLQNVFRYYTSMNAIREQQSTLDLREFTVFAKDCKLIGSFITDHTIKQVLANIQHEEDEMIQQDLVNELRVDFNEFQEAIAALTEYVICNPYIPLYKRIEQFINEMLLPRARQKKKGGGE